jgi:hypothetical protein
MWRMLAAQLTIVLLLRIAVASTSSLSVITHGAGVYFLHGPGRSYMVRARSVSSESFPGFIPAWIGCQIYISFEQLE